MSSATRRLEKLDILKKFEGDAQARSLLSEDTVDKK